MQYRIDYMKPEELNSTLHLIREVFDEFNYEDYEFEGVESFYSFIDKKYIKKQLTSGNMLMLVARTDSNKIIGVIGISAENHISLLFVHKNFHRKGIGTNLLKYATKVCNYNDENLEKITVNSSPYAIEFYHNYGFEDLSELQESDGIVFLPMVLYVKKEGIPDDVSKDLDDVYEILTEFYTEACDEEDRLRSSKRGNLEFITTTTYIDKYLNPGDRILEIGAGPGIYSNYYAEQGYKVDAVELLDVNFQKLKNIESKDLKVHKANAIDLSCFEDDIFDITLCLGPMYHLFSEEERDMAIKEAIRVTKTGGKIFFAYVTNEAVIINYFLREHHFLDQKELHDEDFIVKNEPKEVFFVCTVDEFENKMKNFDITFLNNIATDGIASILRDDIEFLEDEEFEEWAKYHLATCERKDLIGYSSHCLYICEKE
ncbi:MAG: GNAT family N-acetyltransferase [Clostridia bacterium]|nr:GNAT family N-acetyltransferase [Clostridia bacterium]